ncbi:MAG: carboxyl transferase domain-containing protein [Acidimicrobiales bacterium]
MTRLLVANRGEIAIRVMRAAADLGIATVAVHPADDAASLHTRSATEAVLLNGRGVAAYLDIEQLVAVAQRTGCDAVHPGYGFLAENPAFAEACEAAGLIFVGPTPDMLALFGDKVAARRLAQQCGVPVLAATEGPTDLAAAIEFFERLGPGAAVMVKALAGGGGRGMRPVTRLEDLEEAMIRCASEAQAAFGNPALYVEQFMAAARHVEVQIVGDGNGAVAHVWDRECSVQRQRQKLIEIAPAPNLAEGVRARLLAAAIRLGTEVSYRSLGTVEFLVDANDASDHAAVAFIELNARVQVEHTVTEQTTGIDLVASQLQLAAGATLAELALDQQHIGAPRGFAVQARVNLEAMQPDGTVRPTGGVLTRYEPPTGPGVRTDGYGAAGYGTSPSYDSLLAKVIGQGPTLAVALARTERALGEFHIEGTATNIAFLRAMLARLGAEPTAAHTRWVEEHLADLLAAAAGIADAGIAGSPIAARTAAGAVTAGDRAGLAGSRVNTADPLAVLALGKDGGAAGGSMGVAAGATLTAGAPGAPGTPVAGPDGTVGVPAPLQGTIVSVSVEVGDEVAAGRAVLIMESMKMEHVIHSDVSGVVRAINVQPGDAVYEGHPLLFVEAGEVSLGAADLDDAVDLDHIRPDLAETYAHHALGLDENRPEAVARRHKLGHRSVRENVEDLIDDGSWIEYGSLVVAAQRSRRSIDDLQRNTPADGMVAGIGAINGTLFDEETAQAVVLAYDYTVLAGTQGFFNHYKKDRMMELARDWRLPVVFFAEGGGGRPGDVDAIAGMGLDIMTFHTWGQLSGTVPMVGITNGRCFAGNAVILGCCDVVIATEGSNIGMGGPAMIEGGGLGLYRPEEVGPMSVQVPNGVVDIAVRDEAEAVAVAKQYLSYFQGRTTDWECADQRNLRHAIPENRLRIYDVRKVIEQLFDTNSVLEIRRGFGHGMITALARIEGRPVGVIANNPAHLGGAIDSDAADKATRFIQLCDAFDLPIVSLCDTPGNMVGPEYEKQALVRHCCRMFVTAANVSVPFFTIVLRKSYGLGAQGMGAGSLKTPFWTVSWPTGEFGGMGLEGAVKLGFRKELEAEENPEARVALYEKLVAKMYNAGKALNTAMHFEIDEVIDPADSRHWLAAGLKSAPTTPWRSRKEKKRPCVDTW